MQHQAAIDYKGEFVSTEQPEQRAGTIDLDQTFQRVKTELEEAEKQVQVKTVELQSAVSNRDRLRGQIDLLAQMAQQVGGAMPVASAPAPVERGRGKPRS